MLDPEHEILANLFRGAPNEPWFYCSATNSIHGHPASLFPIPKILGSPNFVLIFGRVKSSFIALLVNVMMGYEHDQTHFASACMVGVKLVHRHLEKKTVHLLRPP